MMRIIEVKWHDAGSAATKDEAETIFRHSVGYEVESEPGHGVTISMEEDQLSGVHFIPWGMILSITAVD